MNANFAGAYKSLMNKFQRIHSFISRGRGLLQDEDDDDLFCFLVLRHLCQVGAGDADGEGEDDGGALLDRDGVERLEISELESLG